MSRPSRGRGRPPRGIEVGTVGHDLLRSVGVKLILLVREAYVRVATAVGQPARAAAIPGWDESAALREVEDAERGPVREAALVRQARRQLASALAEMAAHDRRDARAAYAEAVAWALRRVDDALKPPGREGKVAGRRFDPEARKHVLAVVQQRPSARFHADEWEAVAAWQQSLVGGALELRAAGWQHLPVPRGGEIGLGVFATKDLSVGGGGEGQDIAARGRLYSLSGAVAATRAHEYTFTVGCGRVGGAQAAVSMLLAGGAMMFSHSCDANATLQCTKKSAVERRRHVVVRFNPDTAVRAGEEVTISYGWRAPAWRARGGCRCGAAKCVAPA